MSSIVARTGRHLQRYDNNLRLVSGCIPYRLGKSKDHQNRIEVLMVSSPNRDDMVFPKGGWESDETVEEAACRETLEEAGVRGILKGNHLGVWEFKSKSKQEACSEEGGCKGYMFALQVTEELETWPEQNNRNRKWMVIEEAFVLCRYEWMQNALKEFVKEIEKGKNNKEHEIGTFCSTMSITKARIQPKSPYQEPNKEESRCQQQSHGYGQCFKHVPC